MPDFSLILPAAGSSTRFGSPVNKLFQFLAGQPVLLRTLRAFANRPDVSQIVIPCHDRSKIENCVAMLDENSREKVILCKGGDCRAGSVKAGIETSSPKIEWMAVHDAARPLISDEVINRTFQAAQKFGAAGAALPVNLTIKEVSGPQPIKVIRTVPRQNLWAMQTPQIARRADYLKCFANCPIPLAEVTDDMQVLELGNLPVTLVPGDERNLKITSPNDLLIAEMILNSRV